jgi:hypothetical protein
VCVETYHALWNSINSWFSQGQANGPELQPNQKGFFFPHFVLPLLLSLFPFLPIPVAARSKAWVYGRSLTRIVGSNGHGCLSLVNDVCCQVEVSATSWSLAQRSPTECDVSKNCVIVKSRNMRQPRPPRGCQAIGEKNSLSIFLFSLVCTVYFFLQFPSVV